MNITEKIHALRKEKGWSVAKLSRICGIPTVSLRAMLSRNDPNSYNVKTLQKIAKALGVSVSYLTLDEGETLKPKITPYEKKQMLMRFEQLLEEFFEIEEEIVEEKTYPEIDEDDED